MTDGKDAAEDGEIMDQQEDADSETQDYIQKTQKEGTIHTLMMQKCLCNSNFFAAKFLVEGRKRKKVQQRLDSDKQGIEARK